MIQKIVSGGRELGIEEGYPKTVLASLVCTKEVRTFLNPSEYIVVIQGGMDEGQLKAGLAYFDKKLGQADAEKLVSHVNSKDYKLVKALCCK
ncbi:MAG: hypothetical protein JKY96_02325 [Phycisphaerales bacterium]|nr:hypothetical protein [Phycisphaerales bacterium]